MNELRYGRRRTEGTAESDHLPERLMEQKMPKKTSAVSNRQLTTKEQSHIKEQVRSIKKGLAAVDRLLATIRR